MRFTQLQSRSMCC